MINNKKVMAIIPARGGSKRLPRKNVLPLKGKPLIGWTIEAAQQSKYIDTVFVSTDDQEVTEAAKQFSVDVPELRPEHLASDTATTQSVIFYTLETFGQDVDIVLTLQPTSPLRTAKHIDEAIEMLINKNAESIVSVTPCEHPPQWANTLPSDGSMGEFLRPEAFQRSQDLGEPYRLNGAIYVYDTIQLKERGEMLYTDKTFAYVMENKKSVDIDTQLDFEYAEFLLNNKKTCYT